MTETFRFIHLADAHLDTNFYGDKPEVRRILQQEARKSFRRAVELALERKVQALLIAGDLFDGDLLSFSTEKMLLESFKTLGEMGIRVFYAPGNHDYLFGFRGLSRLPWPENVHIFSGSSPQQVEVKDKRGRCAAVITGMGHESPREDKNLAAQFPLTQSSYPHIALLHALVVGHRGSQEHLRYAPCSLADLKGKGYDYWALGHIHTYSQVAEDPPAYYPGNIQGRNPGETGAKGCLLVELQGKELAKADFVPLSRLQWAELHLDSLQHVTTLEKLQQLMISSLQEEISSLPQSAVLLPRLTLSGPSPLYQELKWEDNIPYLQETLAEQMGFPWIEIKTNDLYPPLDVAEYNTGPHLLAWSLDLLARAKEDDELLLSLSPEVLAGVETGVTGSSKEEKVAYLKTLMDNLDKEMILRMVSKE